MNQNFYEKLPGVLLPWFEENARDLPWRADCEPYHVWLSEIMLQQTRVKSVKSYYTRFLAALPDIASLASADEAVLQKLWEGLGYYMRMRNLQKCAKILIADYGGQFPRDYASIRTLPGIGDYTAGAISSICFGMPEPAVDGNVLRVISRIGEITVPIDAPATKRALTEALRAVYPTGRCGEFTQALMELGATVCVPNGAPRCTVCPARDFCGASAHGMATKFPVKKPKRARRVESRTVLILSCGGRIATKKRPENGLLAGLYELPSELGTLTAQQALDLASELGAHPISLSKQADKTHTFTHITWKLRGYYIACAQEPHGLLWQTPEQAALPTAFRIFLEESK